MIWAVLVAGAVMATGLWLMISALRPAPPALADLGGPSGIGVSVAAKRRAGVEPGGRLDRGRRLPATMSEVADRGLYRGLAGDLRVVDHGVERVIFQQVLGVGVGFLVPLLIGVVILPLGGLSTPPLLVLVVAFALAALGFLAPIQSLRNEAEVRRREFAAGLAHYMSFVDVLVSGGNSIDGAFEFAAELGDGWVWDELRFAIASASHATLAPYRALEGLGHELGVVELVNLARRLEQTQATGSAIGPALRSLADSLVRDQARRARIADDEVTEKMTFPLMVVLFALLTFFGIAAVTAILRASQAF